MAYSWQDYYALRRLVNTRDATCSLAFSGVISRVGAAVKDFSCGDRVVGMAPNRLGSYIQVPQWACCKFQKNESFAVSVLRYGKLTLLTDVGHGRYSRCVCDGAIRASTSCSAPAGEVRMMRFCTY
jgi:threonine dehydrogenase-like Zn-dependent dehydrogenase